MNESFSFLQEISEEKEAIGLIGALRIPVRCFFRPCMFIQYSEYIIHWKMNSLFCRVTKVNEYSLRILASVCIFTYYKVMPKLPALLQARNTLV